MDASMLASLSQDLEKWLKPYQEGFTRFERLPEQGMSA